MMPFVELFFVTSELSAVLWLGSLCWPEKCCGLGGKKLILEEKNNFEVPTDKLSLYHVLGHPYYKPNTK